MPENRIDETWHRLLGWTLGQAPSERLAAQILMADGFSGLDPSHPLGGKDGGSDAAAQRDGMRWAVAVYFPRGVHSFKQIEGKFLRDLGAAANQDLDAFAFVTNQEIRLAQRRVLATACGNIHCEIYHLERAAAILDSPPMRDIRRQYLGIDYQTVGGGDGGNAAAAGGSAAMGGRGGIGTDKARGGRGGDAISNGVGSLAVGGDGGHAATPDGRGGRRTTSPAERLNLSTDLWRFGYGGAGANHPEYERRLHLLATIRSEYMESFPHDRKFIEAGIDRVPLSWVNKRLEEMSESWRVECVDASGYVMPTLVQG